MSTLPMEYIESTPDVCGGKPRVAGRRITVQNVAVLHEFRQWSVEQIATELELSLSQVYAALAYYHDHRQEIEQSIREGDKLAKEVGRPLRSFLDQQARKTGTA